MSVSEPVEDLNAMHGTQMVRQAHHDIVPFHISEVVLEFCGLSFRKWWHYFVSTPFFKLLIISY